VDEIITDSYKFITNLLSDRTIHECTSKNAPDYFVNIFDERHQGCNGKNVADCLFIIKRD
jgi:hypothetical protein